MQSYQKDRKPQPYWQKIYNRLEAGQAANVMNRAVEGDESLTAVQVKAAEFIIRTVCPQLASISLDVEVEHRQTLADASAQLLMAGIDPAAAWALLNNDGVGLNGTNQTPTPALEHAVESVEPGSEQSQVIDNTVEKPD